MHAMLNIAFRAAREASNMILDGFQRPDRIKVFSKGAKDFYTSVDKAVEETLIELIRKTYPDHSFLGEESGLQEGKNPDFQWVIDPIDGTRNFIHGLPHFCISIACLQKGRVIHGLIFDPVRQDVFSATHGGGAQLNGQRIRVSDCKSLDEATVSLSCAGEDNFRFSLKLQESMLGKISGLRITGSSALDLAYVASGRIDAAWMAGMKIWDYAAGQLLVQEAGGMISNEKGNPDCKHAKALVCGNPKTFKQLLTHVVNTGH